MAVMVPPYQMSTMSTTSSEWARQREFQHDRCRIPVYRTRGSAAPYAATARLATGERARLTATAYIRAHGEPTGLGAHHLGMPRSAEMGQ